MQIRYSLAVALTAALTLTALPQQGYASAMVTSVASTSTTAVDPAAIAAWEMQAMSVARERLQLLAATGEPRKLLAAALLWDAYAGADAQIGPSQQAKTWYAAAQQAQPRDPIIVWTQAHGCYGLSSTCDKHIALNYLLTQDADNAAVQLLGLQFAHTEGNSHLYDQFLIAAASATHFKDYDIDVFTLIQTALDGVQWPALSNEMADAISAKLGYAMRFRPERDMVLLGTVPYIFGDQTLTQIALNKICGDSAAATSPTMDQACPLALAWGDDDPSLFRSMISIIALIKRDHYSDEGLMRRELLRQHYWYYQNANTYIPVTDTDSDGNVVDYYRWLSLYGEREAMRKLLITKNITTTPPHGWLPTSARARSLILTGQEP